MYLYSLFGLQVNFESIKNGRLPDAPGKLY